MLRSISSAKVALLTLVGCILGAPLVYSQKAPAKPAATQQASPEKAPAQESDREQILNGIMAIVNDDVITYDEVAQLIGSQQEALNNTYAHQPDILRQKSIELRDSAVNELIERHLILQEFKKMQAKGASIPDYVVDDHIQTIIRGSYGGDRKAFIHTLEAQGLTLAKFREMEMERIVVSGMRQREIKTDLIIPPRDVEQYYAQHREDFSTPDQVHLLMISLAKTGDTEATQKELAAEIRQKVAAGADFGSMAQLYSQTHADDKGDWGWVTKNDINDQLAKVAFSIKLGQISNLVDSEGSYWLLYVVEKKPGGVKPFKTVRDDIQKKLLQVQQQQQQEKWIAGLRQKAYIKTF